MNKHELPHDPLTFEPIELSVPGPSGPSAEVEPRDSRVPFDDERCPPPASELEVPHAAPPASPTPGTADIEPVYPRDKRGVPFTSTEIMLAINLREQKYTLTEIGTRLGRSYEGVRHILEQWTSTADLAKATLKKNAVTLADRVVAQADVTQALEVLDRLEVLPKREKDSGGNRVQVILGLNTDDVMPRASVIIKEE